MDENYRVIFVDDEAIIREGISSCVDWGSNGYSLERLFEHGREALDYVRENPVDVVISDINMPHMDGLSFSRILAEEYPQITVLLLTGYDDFEYAQAAVKNHVHQFILKPITAKELASILRNLRAELDRKREKRARDEQMEEKLALSFPLLKERFLNRLVSGRLGKDAVEKRQHYFQWTNLGAFYQVVMLDIPSAWSDLHIFTLLEHMRSLIEPHDEAFQENNENICILLQDTGEAQLADRASVTAEQAFSFSAQMEQEQITVGIGGTVSTVTDISASRREAATAVEYAAVLGVAQILHASEVRQREQIDPNDLDLKTDAIIDGLRTGHRENTKKALNELFNYLEELFFTPEELFLYFNRLNLRLYHFLMDSGLFTDEEYRHGISPGSLTSISAAQQTFSQLLTRIEDRIEERRHQLIHSRLEKARSIISNRYNEPGFSLHDICSELYLSVSQFSLMFKEGTGKTFIEYLTEHRLEAAKELLKTTDMKAYEIAEQVGYKDPRYFSIIFKKHSGITAMEYRRSLEE